MAPRESLDDKLAALRRLRGRALSPEEKAEVRKRIGDRSNLVVAAAAAVAGEAGLVELAADLEAAFDRFLAGPAKGDKLCRAKTAVVGALDAMGHPDAGVFRRAAGHVQFEPVWGGAEDSAPPLRAAAVVALARAEGPACQPALVDALADPAKEVRAAAASALGAVGTEAAGLVLRLKARLGGDDPDVLSGCLGGLLAVDPVGNLALVGGYLDPGDPASCGAAALALGRSRLAGALAPLEACWPRCDPELRRQVLLAVAVLRRPEATDHLVEVVAAGEGPAAADALAALGIFKADPRLVGRVAGAVRARGDPGLVARFEREFGPRAP